MIETLTVCNPTRLEIVNNRIIKETNKINTTDIQKERGVPRTNIIKCRL